VNRLTISSVLIASVLIGCDSEGQRSHSAAENSNKELYNTVNEPLEKANEVEDILKQAVEERDKELDQ